MTLAIRTKQPGELRLMDMDFGPIMREGDAIASVVSVTATNQGNVLGSGELTIGSNSFSGQVAQVWLSDGTDLEDYKVTIIVTTVPGERLEGDSILQVRDL